MIPEKLPDEEHGLGYIRLLMNCVLLGTAVPALLLCFRPFSAGMLLVGLIMAVFALGLRIVQRQLYQIVLYFLSLLGLLILLEAVLGILFTSPEGSRPDIFLLAAAGGIGLLSEGIAVYGRIKGIRLVYPSIPFVIYPVCLYFLSLIFGQPELRVFSYLVEAGLLILILLFYNRRSLTRAFFEAQGYANVPYDKIRRSNFLQMLGLTTLSLAVFVGIALFDNGGALLYRIADLFRQFFTWLLSLLPKASEDVGLSTPSGTGGHQIDFGELLPESESNPAMEAFWNIVMLLVGVLAVIVFAILLVSAIRNFLREFRLARKENNDVSVYAPPQETSVRKAREKGPGIFDQSPSARIRRLYYRFIRKQPGSGRIGSFETPEELEATAGVRKRSSSKSAAGDASSSNAALREVHEIYERARYSGAELSAEEVRRMRSAIRSLEK